MSYNPKQTCNAKTRSGALCRNASMGNGKCRMHGGATPSGADSPQFKHGRYTRYAPAKIREKLDAFEDADALNILPELQVQRALFSEYLSRFEGIPLPADAIYSLVTWADQIARTAERAVKMRNETALTAAEVAFIAARIPDVVMKYISDADQQRHFISELFGIVGGARTDAPQLAISTEDKSSW